MGDMDCGDCALRCRTDMAHQGADHPRSHDPRRVLSLCVGACDSYGDMAAIGNATNHGFLVREGDAPERLSKAKVIAFDKTGTLTYGTPEVVAAESVSASFDKNEDYRLTASAEQFSEHPLGKAIIG